jgi:predicted protein tyrosine phosphatase
VTVEFCSYLAVAERMRGAHFTALISILGSADDQEWPSVEVPHLCLPIDDIAVPMKGYSLASNTQISKLLRFGAVHENLLVHCRAGSSRSAAAALLLEIQRDRLLAEEIEPFVAKFQGRYPFARPNQRIIECGDRSLRLKGRLIAAVKSVFT